MMLVMLCMLHPSFLLANALNGPVQKVKLSDDFQVKVFFAQTHVQEPDDPLFKLIENREVLIKVNITSTTTTEAPAVNALLTLGDQTTTLRLSGPDIVPEFIDYSPGLIQHSFDDSFTVSVPKNWVKPGLEIVLTVADQVITFDSNSKVIL